MQQVQICLFVCFYSLLTLTLINHATAAETISIAMIGDSLIRRAYADFGLGDKMQALVPDYLLSITVFATDGAKISDIQQNQLSPALETKPDMVILYWDSDCSDVDERNMTYTQVGETRDKYASTVASVIEAVQASNTYIAVAGPEILGEGPIKPQRFWFKNPMLNDYRDINEEICESHHVYYMDIRQVFLDTIPPYWIFNSKYLTVDGEHPNERGTEIEAEFFAGAVNNFIESQGEFSLQRRRRFHQSKSSDRHVKNKRRRTSLPNQGDVNI